MPRGRESVTYLLIIILNLIFLSLSYMSAVFTFFQPSLFLLQLLLYLHSQIHDLFFLSIAAYPSPIYLPAECHFIRQGATSRIKKSRRKGFKKGSIQFHTGLSMSH